MTSCLLRKSWRLLSKLSTLRSLPTTCPALLSTVQQHKVKLPVRVHGVKGRYAEALYLAASKQKLLDRVEDDLLKVRSVLRSDHRFRELLTHPRASRLVKVEDMQAILSRLDLSPPSNNLLLLLAENKRLPLLEKVIDGYMHIMSVYRGEILCEVTTAEPLDEAIKQRIKAGLENAFKNRRQATVMNLVKPEIIGGIILKVDDYYVDMSISTKLEKFERLLSGSLLV